MGFTTEKNTTSTPIPKPGSLTAIGIITICLSSISILNIVGGLLLMLVLGYPENILRIIQNLADQFQQNDLSKSLAALNSLVYSQFIFNPLYIIISIIGFIGAIKVLAEKPGGRLPLLYYAFGLILIIVISYIFFLLVIPDLFSLVDFIPIFSHLFKDLYNIMVIFSLIISFIISMAWPVILIIILSRPKVKHYFASQTSCAG